MGFYFGGLLMIYQGHSRRDEQGMYEYGLSRASSTNPKFLKGGGHFLFFCGLATISIQFNQVGIPPLWRSILTISLFFPIIGLWLYMYNNRT